MKRKIIYILLAVTIFAAIAAKLFYNHKEIAAKTKPKISTVDVPVNIAKVGKSSLDNSFSVNGTFFPLHELTLIAETQGKVVQVNFENGDLVKKGQVLVSLDTEMMNAQLQLAQAAYDKSKADYEKFEDMLKRNAVSQQQVQEMKLALVKANTDLVSIRKQLEYAVMKAPFSGYITRKYIENGSMLMPGAPLADLIDISTMKFVADLSETDLPNVHTGMPVSIEADIYDGVQYRGIVRMMGMKATDSKRFPVEIRVENRPDKPIRAGMYGSAYFAVEGKHDALVIPRNALTGSIREPHVFVIENNRAFLKEIILGTVNEKVMEVRGGLKEGDTVVISGQINLDNNTRVVINK